MTLPMTASLSASELVSEATWFSRLSTVPPSPWKTWMISKDTPVHVCRRQRLQQRAEPAEQRGQVQRRLRLGQRDDAVV